MAQWTTAQIDQALASLNAQLQAGTITPTQYDAQRYAILSGKAPAPPPTSTQLSAQQRTAQLATLSAQYQSGTITHGQYLAAVNAINSGGTTPLLPSVTPGPIPTSTGGGPGATAQALATQRAKAALASGTLSTADAEVLTRQLVAQGVIGAAPTVTPAQYASLYTVAAEPGSGTTIVGVPKNNQVYTVADVSSGTALAAAEAQNPQAAQVGAATGIGSTAPPTPAQLSATPTAAAPIVVSPPAPVPTPPPGGGGGGIPVLPGGGIVPPTLSTPHVTGPSIFQSSPDGWIDGMVKSIKPIVQEATKQGG